MAEAKQYRKKPVVITAMEWDGTAEGATAVIQWILDNGGLANYHCSHDMGCPGTAKGHAIAIRTLEGWIQASPGDWVIRGIAREFYPCRRDIFAVTYEAVD
ncbi:hypothetical protein [Nocardia ignorata]|uniref:Uncharacterized protein n=1 Tax=Nocardia ignorata TaxID=145285 RepID=A0A4V3CMJ7_NOCIG|nr:hypothetical protein [Nocardia ignorata]TDP29884.1 hypothetical protein DFR75_112153 [Nocardia ignorata]